MKDPAQSYHALHPQRRAADRIDFDEAEDQLMTLFLEEEDKRPRQYAIIVTCVLFTILFLVSFPGSKTQGFEREVVYVPDVTTYIPPVKEQPREQLERKVVENIKKIALPDPTPEQPEPIREALPEPPPIEIPPNAIVMRGLPPPRRPPPSGQVGPVVEGTAGLVTPVVKVGPKPEYTLLARRAGVEGTVTIRAIVDRQGRVASADLVKGLGYGLDEVCVEAAKKRTYTPGTIEGRPVEVVVTIRYVMKLR